MSSSGKSAQLAVQRIQDNWVFTKGEVWAWYVLPTQRWPFRPDNDRMNAITAMSGALGQLAGRQLHLRVTTQPYPAAQWARQLDRRTPRPLGGRGPESGWPRMLQRTVSHISGSTTAEKIVYLGVRLATRSTTAGVTAKVLRRPSGAEMKGLTRDARLVGEIVAGRGFASPSGAGRPATTAEVEWLIRRSLALGMGAPRGMSPVMDEPWEPEDIHQLEDTVHRTSPPFGPVVQLDQLSPDGDRTAFATVLTFGRVGEIEVPERSWDPWLVHLDSLPFPVEWSIRLNILGGAEAKAAVQRKLLVIRDMQKHYGDHELDEPLALERQARQAREVEDSMTSGTDAASARAHGWFRVAVSGRDEEEVMERARMIMDSYRAREMDVTQPRKISGGATQALLVGEFVPGETLASSAYLRRLPVKYVAAGMPTATSMLGDRRGPYIGFTASSTRRAVMFDTHYSTEVREGSGLVPIVGGLGAGKSVLMGLITYGAVQRGIPCVLLDPSGPLSRLCDLPELAGQSRHIDLTKAPAGTLNPYAVVPEPHRNDFPDDDKYEEARALAAQDRKLLALDIITMLLPPALAAAPRTRMLLAEAVRNTKGAPQTSLWTIVEYLSARRLDRDDEGRGGRPDEDAHQIAAYLGDMAELPLARLFFPVGPMGEHAGEQAMLTVLTMPGLTLPPLGSDREHWSTTEQLAVPLLHLASWYCTRAIYGRTMSERKLVGLDEAHFLGQWAAGRSLFTRLGRDSRKWNACVLAASQSAADVLGMDVGNFVSAAFVGRTEDAQSAADALRLLKVPVGDGYEAVLAGLSPRLGPDRSGYREFVMRDVDGNVDKMVVDLTHLPEVLAALDTTAAPVAAEEGVFA